MFHFDGFLGLHKSTERLLKIRLLVMVSLSEGTASIASYTNPPFSTFSTLTLTLGLMVRSSR
jgi:hypothetical protein